MSILIFLLGFSVTFAWEGRVVTIHDGDTVTVDSRGTLIKIRLYGIDCPEMDQPGGADARKFLVDSIQGKLIDVQPLGTDQYQRVLALLDYQGSNINSLLVEKGLAWVYTGYCKKDFCLNWYLLEKKAREARIGLWQDEAPLPPWSWRKGKRPVTAPSNLSDKSQEKPLIALIIIFLVALGILPLLRKRLHKNFLDRKLRRKRRD